MKKFLKVLGYIAVFIGLIIGVAFYLTAELPKTAEQFFTAVKNDNMDEAEGLLSAAFKASTDRQSLREYLKKNKLDQVESASWGNRSTSGSTGLIEGSVTTPSGTVPVSMHFVKGEDGWKIQHISVPSAGASDSTTKIDTPSEAELVDLVNTTMRVFADSVNAESMADYYQAASASIREGYTVEDLDAIFSNFYGQGDFRTVINNSPRFKQVPVAKDGRFEVMGDYQTPAYITEFELTYVYEGLGWKNVAINVNTKPRE